MGKTSIAWCDFTMNPWIGCTKVSPGCAHCYAEAHDLRFAPKGNTSAPHWGKGKPRRRTSAANWKEPLKWNEKSVICSNPDCDFFVRSAGNVGAICPEWGCGGQTRRQRVFCASLADWLDDEVPTEWLADLLKLIHATPNLDWQLLTKRPENWKPRMIHCAAFCCAAHYRKPVDIPQLCCKWMDDNPPANVWVGTSVEDQKRADERIPHLLKIPAKVRFLSVEPLLGPVDLRRWITENIEPIPTAERIHWVIVGGESGRNARPCNVEWIRSIVAQCQAAGVPCFVKQLGAKPATMKLKDHKGGDMAEWPEDLRVREFPV